MSERLQNRASKFFEWQDQRERTVNPEVDRVMRAEGYGVVHTGGGCLAWEKSLGEDSRLWITNDADIDGDPQAPERVAGRYDGEGWISLEPTSLSEALRSAALLPAAIDSGGQPVEIHVENVQAALARIQKPAEAPRRQPR